MTFHTNRIYSNESISMWDHNNDLLASSSDDASVWIVANYSKNPFAGSLFQQFCRYGKLSERQWATARNAAAKAKAPKPTPAASEMFPNIRALIDSALHNSALKAPHFEFRGIKFKMAKSSSKWAGSIFVGDFPSMGCIGLDGSLTKWRGMSDENLAIIRELETDPKGKIAQEGKALNSCCFCHKELSDPRSVEAGWGQKCASNFGLDW